MSRGDRQLWHKLFAAVQANKAARMAVVAPRNAGIVDHIDITLPYCKTTLTWAVCFNIGAADTPPDFVFEEGDEAFVALKDVESLREWRPSDESSLLRVLLELRDKYKDCNRRRAEALADERLKFEMETVLAGAELHVRTRDHIEIDCCCPLSVDVSLLPPSTQNAFHITPETCPPLLLLATFRPHGCGGGNPPVPSLDIPPPLAAFLSPVALPPWNAQMCLAEYIPMVEEIVKTKMLAVQKRNALMRAMRVLFGVPLEYDSALFHRIAFLFEADKLFNLVVHFYIGPNFPTEQPTITFQTILVSSLTPPTTFTYSGFPYSPRWPPDEMAQRMRCFIVDKLKEFKEMYQDQAAQHFNNNGGVRRL